MVEEQKIARITNTVLPKAWLIFKFKQMKSFFLQQKSILSIIEILIFIHSKLIIFM